MTGLHSSDPATVYLSARARVTGFKQGDLGYALYEDKTLVRIQAMRRTLFVVPVEMAPMLHHSSTVALIGPERRRLAGWVENSGIADDGAAWIDTVSRKTVAAMRRRGEAVATDLTKDVAELREKITFYKTDGSVQTTVGMSTRILFLLATEGEVIRGRPKGTWVSAMYRWAPMDDWLGGPMPVMSKAEAQAAVLRKWLATFGPGTEIDMKWWTGWPVTQVRAAWPTLARSRSSWRRAPDTSYPTTWIRCHESNRGLPCSPRSIPRRWGGRNGSGTWDLTPRGCSTATGTPGRRSGSMGGSLVPGGNGCPGRWCGSYSRTSDASRLLEVERQAEEVETWLSDKRVIARFASPLDRELSAR